MTARIRSVQWRLLSRLLPLLGVIFVGAWFWLGRHLTETLQTENLELARRSSQVVLYAVQMTMLTEGGHGAWDKIGRSIPHDEGTQIEIVNARGRILLSTAPTNRGGVRRLADSPCKVCHDDGVLRPTIESALFREPGDESHQIFAAPLNNAEQCRACHDQSGHTLGMVLVIESLEPINRQVRNVQVALAGVGAAVLLMTIVTTRLLLGRYINRPLKRLVAGANAIGAGDLDYTIELPEHTELAVLADTLNRSTAHLAQLQREKVENERLAAIGQTVAGLSHTLKNVLNGLRAGQYVLDRAMDKGDQEKLQKGLRVTKSSVRRVERLIFDMLYYAKDRVPRRELIDANDIIQEVVDELHDMAKARGVELRAEMDESIGVTALDRTSIYRALVDLVTNAADACTESETGDLVVLKSMATPDEIVLTVEDNGIGMSEEVIGRLYTRFFSTKAAGGTGLGLHVVKKIAEEHGGRITVDSVPGAGSAFHIHLPRVSEIDTVPTPWLPGR